MTMTTSTEKKDAAIIPELEPRVLHIPKEIEAASLSRTRREKTVIYQVWHQRLTKTVLMVAGVDPATGEAFGFVDKNIKNKPGKWCYFNLVEYQKNGAELTNSVTAAWNDLYGYVAADRVCVNCGSDDYGFKTIKRSDPCLTADTFKLWICRNCAFQPFSDIRGLV